MFGLSVTFEHQALLYFDLFKSSKIKDGFWMLVVKWKTDWKSEHKTISVALEINHSFAKFNMLL